MHHTKMSQAASKGRGRLLGAVLVPALLACGCQNMNHTEQGALGGAAVGAGAGALIGHATGHTGAGALIGAVVGTITGAAVGDSVDEHEKRHAEEVAAARALSLNEVVQMTHDHLGEDIIINQIRTRGTVFSLSADDLRFLKENGVSDVVITEMQATQYRVPRRVYVADPYYYSDPPVRVGIGYTVIGGGRWR